MADYSMEAFIEDVRKVFAETDDAKAQAQAVCGHMTMLLQVPGLLDGKMDVPETGTATASLYQDEDYGHPGRASGSCATPRPRAAPRPA